MGVSKNNGTPKSSIFIGFSIINHPFWGTPIFGNTHIYSYFHKGWSKSFHVTTWALLGKNKINFRGISSGYQATPWPVPAAHWDRRPHVGKVFAKLLRKNSFIWIARWNSPIGSQDVQGPDTPISWEEQKLMCLCCRWAVAFPSKHVSNIDPVIGQAT